METTRSSNRWLELFRASHAWGSEWNLDALAARITADTHQFLKWDATAVFLLEKSGLALRTTAPANFALPDDVPALAREAIRSGRMAYGHDISGLRSGTKSETKAMVCAPLSASRGILGALYLESATRQIDADDEEFLEALALQAATALEHALLFNSAITDPLTGLLTHRHFQQEVEQAVRRSSRSEQPLSLILLDLDHFKQLNDTCGHAVGNTCLTSVAEVLKATLRGTDAIARFGGDEFEVLLPDTPLDAALRVAEKLRKKIHDLKFEVQVTGTFGVAAIPENAADPATLFLRADAALYEAKEAGRNTVVASKQREEIVKRPPQAERRAAEPPASASAQMNAVPVEKIDGHELLGRLGTGTNGEVLLVKQPELEREVALKRPLTPYLTNDQMRAFELEARVTASLNHPGVVTIHTMGRDSDGRRYYTMKPLQGHSLAHVLSECSKGVVDMRRAFPQTRLLEILQRAGETLSYAHTRNVCHLDLTPSNIVIGEFGEVTVIDWGCGASQSGLKGGSGPAVNNVAVVAGSPRYLAPEQIPSSGGKPGPASDVFALGAMMYEVLTGKPPFAGKNVSETFNLLVNGRALPPELAAPDIGIAPALSALCMSSLSRDPSERPSVQEFAEKLGRYVRREPEWIVTKFGADYPLDLNDWTHVCGAFEIINGEWVSTERTTGSESVVLWKTPVSGSFRFVAEGWLEGHTGELTLLGRTSLEGDLRVGYGFHAAAEANSLCKLGRSGIAIAASANWTAEPKKKYPLELEYDEEEGWVRCYIDHQQIFSYRELFPISGSYVGLYSFGSGTHIRPLEIHRRIWGLQVPAIRVADTLMTCGLYDAALEKYNSLSEQAASRLEGAEARLKMGLCLNKLSRTFEAEKMLASLAGTPLEPLGVAELAGICLRRNGEPWRAARLIEDLLRKYPQSQARWRIIEILNTFTWSGYDTGLPVEEHLRLFQSMFSSMSRLLKPVPFSQANVRLMLINVNMLLGAFPAALDEAQLLMSDLAPRQKAIAWPWFVVAAIANGRDELLSYKDEELFFADYWARDWASSIALHVAVRLKKTDEFLEYCDERLEKGNAIREVTLQDMVQLSLATGQVHRANKYLDRLIKLLSISNSPGWFLMDVCTSLVECDSEPLLHQFFSLLNIEASHPDIYASALAQLALQRGELDKAAALLSRDMPANYADTHNTGLLRQVMLHSLGLLKGPAADLALKNYKSSLCGTRLEMAEMFLGNCPPVPAQKWPHPYWRSELRLWLAIWLEQKGKKRDAHAVAKAAVDSRYGKSHSQPALRRLVVRTQ